jgi:sarcosine oxidase subunit gamma
MSEANDLLIGIEDVSAGQVTLKADLSDPAVARELEAHVGAALPEALRVATVASGARVVWMAPDELLILLDGDHMAANDMVASLGAGLSMSHNLVLNVSDTRAVFRLTGAAVGEVLAKGAPCDCSDHGFPPGTARRTHMTGLAVGLWRLDAETWEVVCFRSFAHHLAEWLAFAARADSAVGAH